MNDAPPLRVLAISGSLRRASSNTALLEAAALLAPAGMTIERYDELGELPHFNPDRERDDWPAVDRLRRAVHGADGLLFSTPEYARGLPGSLKYALDWLVGGCEITHKPCAIFHASPSSVHAVASLVETLRTMSCRLVDEASITVSLRSTTLDAQGIAAHPDAAPVIVRALTAFARAIEAYRVDPGYLPPVRHEPDPSQV